MLNKKFVLYYISPFLWYLSITVGVPLINNFFSGYQSNFFEHATTIILVSVIITGLLFVVLRRKKQNTSPISNNWLNNDFSFPLCLARKTFRKRQVHLLRSTAIADLVFYDFRIVLIWDSYSLTSSAIASLLHCLEYFSNCNGYSQRISCPPQKWL